MKNTFLQAVSHDLRTPLAAILGLAVTLERDDIAMEAGEARDLAGRIAKNARKLDRLVADLLDMDRLAQGIVSPKLEYLDVGDVVRRTVADSEAIDRERLTTDIRRVLIPVDASKVERIVENLLANTARHTPSNAHVWVSVHPHDRGRSSRSKTTASAFPPTSASPSSSRSSKDPTRRSIHLGRGRADARSPVRRAPRRPSMDRGARRRRVVVPGVPPGTAAGRDGRLASDQSAAHPATTGWSTATGPTCAAPPGIPAR